VRLERAGLERAVQSARPAADVEQGRRPYVALHPGAVARAVHQQVARDRKEPGR
jgi:hypothetical protein